MAKNKNLNKAKSSKYDEFYIIKADVYEALCQYRNAFCDKTIYCNTDDYRMSNIWKVLFENFESWGLKKLIATGFNKNGHGIYAEYDGNLLKTAELKGNGDFRSGECLSFLRQCDICVSCPPFSLNREYLHIMHDSGKRYLTLSHLTVCTYPWVIERIKSREMTRSSNIVNNVNFTVPADYTGEKKLMNDGTYQTHVNCIWLTNMLSKSFKIDALTMKKRQMCEYEFITTKNGTEVLFPKTLNDIPVDYEGLIRLPISSINYINPKTGMIEAKFDSSVCSMKQNIRVIGNEETATGDYRFYSKDGKKKFPGLVVEKKLY